MDHATRAAYVLLCLLAPAGWGLWVEWVFHAARRRRGGRDADSPADEPTTGPDRETLGE